MGLAGGVAFTSSEVQNIKCILILIFFRGNLLWHMHTQCIWEDNGKVVFSALRLNQPLGSGGGWRAVRLPDFIIQRQPRLD